LLKVWRLKLANVQEIWFKISYPEFGLGFSDCSLEEGGEGHDGGEESGELHVEMNSSV
jgi:hypothetical protein